MSKKWFFSCWKDVTWWYESEVAGTPWNTFWRGTIHARWGFSVARALRHHLTKATTSTATTFYTYAPSIAAVLPHHPSPYRLVKNSWCTLFHTHTHFYTSSVLTTYYRHLHPHTQIKLHAPLDTHYPNNNFNT